MNYKKIFKIARNFRNLSQGELADLLDYDQSLISRIEKGERKPSEEMLARLEEKLGIPRKLIILIGSPEEQLNFIGDTERELLVKTFLDIIKKYEQN